MKIRILFIYVVQRALFFFLMGNIFSCSFFSKKDHRHLSSISSHEQHILSWKKEIEKFSLKEKALSYSLKQLEGEEIKRILEELKESLIFSTERKVILRNCLRLLVLDNEIFEHMNEKIYFFHFIAKLIEIRSIEERNIHWEAQKILLSNNDVLFQGALAHSVLFRNNGKIYKGFYGHYFKEGESIEPFLENFILLDEYYFHSVGGAK